MTRYRYRYGYISKYILALCTRLHYTIKDFIGKSFGERKENSFFRVFVKKGIDNSTYRVILTSEHNKLSQQTEP